MLVEEVQADADGLRRLRGRERQTGDGPWGGRVALAETWDSDLPRTIPGGFHARVSGLEVGGWLEPASLSHGNTPVRRRPRTSTWLLGDPSRSAGAVPVEEP